jgi:Uma2 family endonuclease
MSTLISGRLASWRADEFLAGVEAGIFGERRLFLWNESLCEKLAKTEAHVFVEGTVADALCGIVPPPWLVRGEAPIRLSGRYVPLPDLVVVRGPWAQYRDRRPTPDDVGLVVEIAVTSLANDLGPQAAVYARAGVPCYWVVDPLKRRVVAHRGPRPEGSYESVSEHGPGDEIELILDAAPVGRIAVSDLF